MQEVINSPQLTDIPIPEPYKPLTEPFKSEKPLPEILPWEQASKGLREYLTIRYGEEVVAKEIAVTPEITSYYLLEYLSGRPGEIRRTGSTYRRQDYDQSLIDTMAESIKDGKEIPIFFLSFAPKFRNEAISGGQLKPDMANYLAFVNLHNIIEGSRNIYTPGVRMTAAYEGKLYRALGRYSEESIESTYHILRQLNAKAAEKVHGNPDDNPIELIDAVDLVQQCLLDYRTEGEEEPERLREREFAKTLRERKVGLEEQYFATKIKINDYITKHTDTLITDPAILEAKRGTPEQNWYDFLKQKDILLPILKTILKEEQAINVSGELEVADKSLHEQFVNHIDMTGKLEAWMRFYRGTMSPDMMPEGSGKEAYIRRMAFYYRAFNDIKYKGGLNDRGIMGFENNLLPTTVNGGKKMNIQLTPGFDYFPHHRLTARVAKNGKHGEAYTWKPLSMEEMRTSKDVFIPQYVAEYDYPFYYEQLKEIGNLDAKTSMGASVRIMETEHGEKYIVKRADISSEYDHLLRQVHRMQEMRAAGVIIVPELVDVNIKDDAIYYVMPFIKGESADKPFFEEGLTDETISSKINTLLSTFNQELWSKGEPTYEQQHFSQRHVSSIERGLDGVQTTTSDEVQKLLANESFTVNGEQVTNVATLLEWLKQSSPLIDQVFEHAKIPAFTHGDLHFGNILLDENGQPRLIDVNGTEEREKSTIEFEVSRMLLSFYREIITNDEYRITTEENGDLRLMYTQRGMEILKKRQEALDAVMEHPDMKKWFTDKEQSKHMIELMEAIHIVTVFHKRPHEQQQGTYVIGTQLLEQAIKKSGYCDTAILEEMKDMVTLENYRDISTYKRQEDIYQRFLAGRYTSYGMSHMFDQWVMHATQSDGTITSYIKDSPVAKELGETWSLARDSQGVRIMQYDFSTLLQEWQRLNFPENGKDKLFFQYPGYERQIWDSLLHSTPIEIAEQQYTITDILGVGKESKAFRAVDASGNAVAIKIGLQDLGEEYAYAMELKAKAGDQAWRFPQYIGQDTDKNILVMELIDGQQTEDIVSQLRTPDEWNDFLHEMSLVIQDIASLHTKGVFAGQFNLRNVMEDTQGKYRILDPLYSGEKDVYEAKQMLRIAAVLIQKIYHTEPGMFPLNVKQLNDVSELRSLLYPSEQLEAIENKDVGIAEPVKSEAQRIFKKYLSNGIGTYTLEDMADDFEGLQFLCEKMSDIENNEAPLFSQRPKAVLLDLNGTIENGGFINKRTVVTINRLAERGFPVGIVSGKRYESVVEILEKNGVTASLDIFTDDGTAHYKGGELQLEVPILDIEDKVAKIESLLQQQSIKAHMKYNNRRINLAFYEESETGLQTKRQSSPEEVTLLNGLLRELGLTGISTNNKEQLDLVTEGHNKATAVTEFAKAYGISEDEIVTIGNEPEENDRELLYKDGVQRKNAFSVKNVAETTYVLEKLMNRVGYGAKYESGVLSFEGGQMDDFAISIKADRDLLHKIAAETSNAFYPYFALRDRLSLQDSKSVDYKWMVYDEEKKPIGIAAIYELPEKGMYNIGGIYLVPAVQGTGTARRLIETMFAYGETQIEAFKGFRVRVAEPNIPSRKLTLKAGFVPVAVRPDDYTLVVGGENGEQIKMDTIVYERVVASSGSQSLLQERSLDDPEYLEQMKKTYEDYAAIK